MKIACFIQSPINQVACNFCFQISSIHFEAYFLFTASFLVVQTLTVQLSGESVSEIGTLRKSIGFHR